MTPISKWYPTKFFERDGQLRCQWSYLGDLAFTDPFFHETIVKARSININSKPYTPLSDLQLLTEWTKEIEYLNPSAFIFHVSRCGSTLLTQLLGTDNLNICLAEVPAFDQILRLPFQAKTTPHNVSDQELLSACFKFYGQKRSQNEQHLFIKTDSWHLMFWKQIRELYPEVPFILLYRSPDEVLRSHRKLRGMQAVPGVIEPEVFGWTYDEIKEPDLDKYLAKVLELYFEALIEIAVNDGHRTLINYHEGAISLLEKSALACGLNISEEQKTNMLQRSQFHAKFPDKMFREEETGTEIPVYLQKAISLYRRLDGLKDERQS